MKIQQYTFLAFLGFALSFAIAQFQPAPGYLDAEYYYAGGIQLVEGKGFTEPYLWNYLDGVTLLPHPSHGYWMPLASILSALGMALTGQTGYLSARIFFFLIAAFAPPLTAALAYSFSRQKELAFVSGLLAVFSIYNAPFVAVTDNFGPFMLFGALYFLLITRISNNELNAKDWLLLGLTSGLMTLARSDGLLWLGLAFLYALLRSFHLSFTGFLKSTAKLFSLALLGFLLVMGPWYLRNLSVYGSIMAPGGSRVLWLDHYDQTFAFPPTLLSLRSFLALGWQEILSDRVAALGSNLLSTFAAHGGILLFPFILVGIYAHRRDERVRLAATAFLILFVVMTFIFPFAGSRGSFFHAGAALQPMWWSLAPLGLEKILEVLRRRNWGNDQTRVIFRSALVMISVILTGFVIYLRLFALGWSEVRENYGQIDVWMQQRGIVSSDIVIVRNAPGYYLQTGRQAIAFPYGGEQAIFDVARQFNSYYLVLEPEALNRPLILDYQDQNGGAEFLYLGEMDNVKIYKIEIE